MPQRDYKFVQEARKTGKIKISVKGLTRALECVPVECQGYCCKSHNSVLTSHYYPGELSKLPNKLRKFICEDGSTVKLNNNKDCSLIPYCQENPSIIPTECRLFPLRFNNAGRLILTRWVWVKPCPAYNKGRPIYIAMKQCLIDIFSEEIYKKIVKEIENAIPML